MMSSKMNRMLRDKYPLMLFVVIFSKDNIKKGQSKVLVLPLNDMLPISISIPY